MVGIKVGIFINNLFTVSYYFGRSFPTNKLTLYISFTMNMTHKSNEFIAFASCY